VTLPLVLPAVVAGSIFTFSLTLGDYILPGLIADEQFIGTVIYTDRGTQLPVAAAFALVPIAVMTAYLVIAKRLGAFENL
jgi:putative spermidine/putrescine transport system permease protein